MKERKAGSRRRNKKVAFIDTNSKMIVTGLKRKKSQNQKVDSSYIKLIACPSGRFLGLFWPQELRYQILDLSNYEKSSNSWVVIDEGKAHDLAWYGPKDKYSYCIIGIKTEETEEKVKKSRLITVTNKKITVEKQIRDLKLKEIDENGKLVLYFYSFSYYKKY